MARSAFRRRSEVARKRGRLCRRQNLVRTRTKESTGERGGEMDSQLMAAAGSAAMGAVAQELVYWYNLRHKLDQTEYRDLLRSWNYWLIVLAMVAGTAVISLIWFDGQVSPSK